MSAVRLLTDKTKIAVMTGAKEIASGQPLTGKGDFAFTRQSRLNNRHKPTRELSWIGQVPSGAGLSETAAPSKVCVKLGLSQHTPFYFPYRCSR